MNSFLCPNTSSVRSYRYFGIFEDINNLNQYDWCGYILDWLLDCVKSFNRGKSISSGFGGSLGGCLYYLAVSISFFLTINLLYCYYYSLFLTYSIQTLTYLSFFCVFLLKLLGTVPRLCWFWSSPSLRFYSTYYCLEGFNDTDLCSAWHEVSWFLWISPITWCFSYLLFKGISHFLNF